MVNYSRVGSTGGGWEGLNSDFTVWGDDDLSMNFIAF